MNMLVLEIVAMIALILGMLSLFGLEDWVIKFIVATIALAYSGFMLGVGFYLATMLMMRGIV